MKIIDIISEDISEGWVSNLARSITGAGAKLLGTSERKALIDQFARRYNPNYTMTPADLARIRTKFPREDPNDVAQEILKRSEKIRDWNIIRQNTQRISQRWDSIKNIIKGLKHLWVPLIGAELTTILWEPFSHYSDRMDLAEQWLNAKEESERWSQEKYDQFHRSELMALVEKLAGLLITYKILKLPGRALNIFGKGFGNTFNRLTTPARLWLANEIATDKEFSSLLSIKLIEEYFGKPFITENLGSMAVQAEDYIFGKVKQAEQFGQQPSADQTEKSQPTAPKSTTKSSDQSAVVQPITGTKKQEPAQAKKELSLDQLTPINPEDWEYYSQSLIRYKPTGQLFNKAVVDSLR